MKIIHIEMPVGTSRVIQSFNIQDRSGFKECIEYITSNAVDKYKLMNDEIREVLMEVGR